MLVVGIDFRTGRSRGLMPAPPERDIRGASASTVLSQCVFRGADVDARGSPLDIPFRDLIARRPLRILRA